MAYFLNLFSPDTYEAFNRSNRDVSGFSLAQQKAAQRIDPGDRFICYLTKLSRWVGLFDVISACYVDNSPIFYDDQDPFVVRFKVKPVVWLPLEKAYPIREDELWSQLSFTKDHDPATSTWTGKLRGSLTKLGDEDAKILEDILHAQSVGGKTFALTVEDSRRLRTHTLRRSDAIVEVSVPDEEDSEKDGTEAESTSDAPETRESLKKQALLASIGIKMGFKVWVPRADKSAILSQGIDASGLVDTLPLNYDSTTLKTIEQIDVIWLRGRRVTRAFEVEHTTSIYSGILRMADLIALQPNIQIKLHIVAPEDRRAKVFRELKRPIFSVLEGGPLSDFCTYLPYAAVDSVAAEKHLHHLSDAVLDDFSEEAIVD